MKQIPKSLQIWFKLHFLIDFIIAIPLIFFPKTFLILFGVISPEIITTRLVGAALLGIGGVSWYAHKKSYEVYDTLLTLKIIWSSSAIFGLGLSLIQGAPAQIWIFLIIFIIFLIIWSYYKIKITPKTNILNE